MNSRRRTKEPESEAAVREIKRGVRESDSVTRKEIADLATSVSAVAAATLSTTAFEFQMKTHQDTLNAMEVKRSDDVSELTAKLDAAAPV